MVPEAMGQALLAGSPTCRELSAGCEWRPAQTSSGVRQAAWRSALGEAVALLVEGTANPQGIQDSVDAIKEPEGECCPGETLGVVACPWFGFVPEGRPLEADWPDETFSGGEPEERRETQPAASKEARDQDAGMASPQVQTQPAGAASGEFPEGMVSPAAGAQNAPGQTARRARIPLEIPEFRPPAGAAAARSLGHSAGEALLRPVAAGTEFPACGEAVTEKGGGNWREFSLSGAGIPPETRARQSETQAGRPFPVAERLAGRNPGDCDAVAEEWHGSTGTGLGSQGSGRSDSLPSLEARQEDQPFGAKEKPTSHGRIREGVSNGPEGAPHNSSFPPRADLAADDARIIQPPAAGGPRADADAGRTRMRSGAAPEPMRPWDGPPAPGGGRQLELQVEGAQGERVRIRLADSNMGVRLRLASNEARVAAALRAGWPELERALQAAGWKAERVAEATPRAATAAVGGLDEPGPVRGGSFRSVSELAWHRQDAFGSNYEKSDSQGSRGRRQDSLRDEWLDLSALRRLSARRHS